MNEMKRKLIADAERQYFRIFPCSSRRELGDCFTIEDDTLLFWFNTEDSSTHVRCVELA